MYDTVFSALMTLTGLTFAALGLLLDGQEKHWIRHAHVWEQLRRRSLPVVGVLVILTSAIILWRIDLDDPAYSLWWNIVVVMFSVSLLALVLPLEHTRRLVDPEAILDRLTKRHIELLPIQEDLDDDWADSASDVVRSYMNDVKELLSGSLGSVDLNGYGTVHSAGLVKPSLPMTGLEDCITDPDLDALRLRVAGLIAVEALGEARAQFDASSGARAVNVICARTMKEILEAWVEPNTSVITAGNYRAVSTTAQDEVLSKGCGVLARCLEGALSAPRPSQTLVDALVEALGSALGHVDAAVRHDAISRLVVGVERAVSAGNDEEAGSALGVFTPQVLESVDSMVFILKALLAEYRKDEPSVTVAATLHRLVREWMNATDRADSEKSLLAQRTTSDLVATARSLSSSATRLGRLAQVVADVVPRLDMKKPLDALLAELQDSDDAVLELFMRHVYANAGNLEDRDQVLYNFQLERLRNLPVDSDEAVRAVVTWLDPTALYLARVRPDRLGMLRKHACAALRKVHTQSCNVNPIFLSVVFARARAERASMREGTTPLPAVPDGALTNPADGSRAQSLSQSVRVPVNQVLWYCYDVLDNGLALSREKLVPVPFSVEVRRSAFGSLSLLFCDLDEMADDDLVDLLFDEKLVWSIETAFELGVEDLGDVSLYLDRIRAAAGLAAGLTEDRSARARSLRTRWQFIGLKCEQALAIGGFGRPAEVAPASPDETAEGTIPGDPASGEEFRFDESPTPVASPPQRLLDVLSLHVDVPGSTGPVDETTIAVVRERAQLLMSLLDRKWDWGAAEVDVVDHVGGLALASGTRLFDEAGAREVACLVMADLVLQRLPKWAVRLRDLVDRALRASDAELMFMVLRTSRSSLARVKGVRNTWMFSAKSPFYVFSQTLLDSEDLLRNGTLAMEAAISDWILGGINTRPGGEPMPEETEAELTSIVGATVAAMERRFRREQQLLRRIPSFWNVEKDLKARLAAVVHPAVAADDVPDDMTDTEA